MVTARFKVSRVTPMGGPEPEKVYAHEVEMTPDYAGGANEQWSKATPSGMCRLTITNPGAVELLPLGASLEFRIVNLDAQG